MITRRFSSSNNSAFVARYEAQRIAFGPIVFHCVRYAWKRGLLQALADAADKGLTVLELADKGLGNAYAIGVVLESSLSAGVVELRDGRYLLDKVGFCILTDTMTQVNLDFVHDVCYQGMAHLEASLDAQQPLGLSVLGDWSTLYEGMSMLPEPARSSWFAFDHFYSDTLIQSILPDVFKTEPKHLMDIGANTGRFAAVALQHDAAVQMHLVDLPQQLAIADKALRDAGLRHRTQFHPVNLLDENCDLPQGMDVIWMSQFLSCFSEVAIASILQRAAQALADGGHLLILDTLWDLQKYEIAAYCLINSSPYFTAMASGNSKIYESEVYIRLCNQVGLKLIDIREGLGYGHALLRFQRE
ncbi:class I SAM-dependent methyltransferase [Rhodoferax sp.]|uniref:class I SAM-dependent methyltransferase n=1 Tax=Rhodoferax sp. TaxID=50421 RepID=UPI0019E25D4B|nr:class I SAM-dependent methyltransferase [Rhodoferax sp.]MBE0474612.1 class I SAM-dependent methyltransferase [Rhodoferax sp.]